MIFQVCESCGCACFGGIGGLCIFCERAGWAEIERIVAEFESDYFAELRLADDGSSLAEVEA